MEIKWVEIRDEGTFISALAFRMTPHYGVAGQKIPMLLREAHLRWRSGYSPHGHSHVVGLIIPNHHAVHLDAFDHFNKDAVELEEPLVFRSYPDSPLRRVPFNRTIPLAHLLLQMGEFDKIETGGMIDVGYEMGLYDERKESEVSEEPII